MAVCFSLARVVLIAALVALPVAGQAGLYPAGGPPLILQVQVFPEDGNDRPFSNRPDPSLPPGAPVRRADFEIPEQGDWDGIRKDTFYFLFSQIFVIGVLYVMPEDMSGWSDEQKKADRYSKWRDNVSDIVWDGDRWWINYMLHPYWGGAYYVRARERGYGDDEAFWYSMLLSTIYEYGAEALFETPSIQDMILTPGLGYFVGRYFMNLREGIRAQLRAGQELSTGDRVILFVTDPLGSVHKVFDRVFGIDGDYMLSPFMVMPPAQAAFYDDDLDMGPRAVGAEAIVPGLQLNLRW